MADQNKLSEALRRLVRAPENNITIVHGFVAKYKPGKNNASGTIDFISTDGTIRIPEISLSTIPGLKKGQIVTPTIKSDVTIVWEVGTGNATIISLSHVDTYTNIATKSLTIGVTGETTNNENDYNEQDDDGNNTHTTYTPTSITSTASNKSDTATFSVTPTNISFEKNNSKIELKTDSIKNSIGNSYVDVKNNEVTLGGNQISIGEGAQEPALLGEKTALLLTDFITACTQITVPTMLGTMPIINIPQFAALLPRCQEIKSLIVKVK